MSVRPPPDKNPFDEPDDIDATVMQPMAFQRPAGAPAAAPAAGLVPPAFGQGRRIVRMFSLLAWRIPVSAALMLGLIVAALPLLVRALFVGALFGLPAVARAIGDQVGGKLRSHLAARRVMLFQEVWERAGRYRFQQASRRLVADVTGARKELGRAFACFEILSLSPRHRADETTDQKRNRRKKARSARHSLFSRCGKRLQRPLSQSTGVPPY